MEHRVCLIEARAAGIRVVVEGFGPDRPRRDAIDADVERRPFDGDGLRQKDDTGARRASVGDVRQAPPNYGDDVDDVSRLAAITPVARGVLHHVPGAVQVGVDYRIPALRLDIDGRLRELTSGVVDQDVQPAVLAPDLVHHRGDLVRVTYGHRVSADFAAQAAQEFSRLLQPLLIAAADGDGRAQAREQRRRDFSDSGSAAGHEDYLIAKDAIAKHGGELRDVGVGHVGGLVGGVHCRFLVGSINDPESGVCVSRGRRACPPCRRDFPMTASKGPPLSSARRRAAC